MQQIDETRLESDLAYRFQYLAQFMGFGEADIQTIHGAAPLLAPLVPALVDAVYDKLQQYDATWRHFLPKQAGYSGQAPQSLEELTMDHDQIKFRKQHLARYLERLVTAPYDGKMVDYLNTVGQIHTPKAGNPDINVPLVQMNALMGFVADAILSTIHDLEIPQDAKDAAARSFSKLLWIQNDLITKHYSS